MRVELTEMTPRILNVARIHDSVTAFPITSVTAEGVSQEEDELSIEEPLQIVVAVSSETGLIERPVAITMRTPGDDAALAAGFLLTEGIIQQAGELSDIQVETSNLVRVTLAPTAKIDLSRLERNSFISSSCGVCGKRSIASVFCQIPYRLNASVPQVRPEIIYGLNQTLRAAQPAFARTGSIHAAALFDTDGRLKSLFEDVGRHNALDKLIGSELLAGRLPLSDSILFLSGRASFELIQKAAIAGIPVTAAVGAPSSLAVELARQCLMTLCGFVRDHRFNVYADAGRLLDPATVGDDAALRTSV